MRGSNLAYPIALERPFESLKVGLALLPDNYGFPSGEEFSKALEERDMYHKRVSFDLLDRLENDSSKEPTALHDFRPRQGVDDREVRASRPRPPARRNRQDGAGRGTTLLEPRGQQTTRVPRKW